MAHLKKTLQLLLIMLGSCVLLFNCKNENIDAATQNKNTTTYPSDVITSLDQWSITLGDGAIIKELENYESKDFFYAANDGADWIVYKTPNAGVTTPNSSNTRTELGQKARWKPETDAKLTGTLKVQHVSTSGDARVAASYSVVIGQIHSDEGHKNEPLKIFYKKFPGHTKGSVFWNYEINTEGSNDERWDYSTAVWGYDMSVVGDSPSSYPPEPTDGIALGEEFNYEVIVTDGIMKLKFTSSGHESKTFSQSLVESKYSKYADIPQQILTLYSSIGRDGTEKSNAYAGELQFFKQGAYNQTNNKNPEDNMVWSTGSDTYDGDIPKQYDNGSYAEVWFKESSISIYTKAGNE